MCERDRDRQTNRAAINEETNRVFEIKPLRESREREREREL